MCHLAVLCGAIRTGVCTRLTWDRAAAAKVVHDILLAALLLQAGVRAADIAQRQASVCGLALGHFLQH